MRKMLLAPLIAFLLTSALAVPLQAILPLYGSMALDFYPVNPIWRGTISGDINGLMFFFNVGTGKQGNQAPGKTIHFGEIWLITDEAENMLLTGTDKGVVSLDGSEYRMNGEVTDAGEGWEHLIGRNVHMSGYITWQNIGTPEDPVIVPETAPGIFRVN